MYDFHQVTCVGLCTVRHENSVVGVRQRVRTKVPERKLKFNRNFKSQLTSLSCLWCSLKNNCHIKIKMLLLKFTKKYLHRKMQIYTEHVKNISCVLAPSWGEETYYIELAKSREQSVAPGVTLVDTEIKCLLFTDDLVFLSPTKEGLQQHLDLPHNCSQTWALTVNQTKTKLMIFQKGPSLQHHKYAFFLDKTVLEHT